MVCRLGLASMLGGFCLLPVVLPGLHVEDSIRDTKTIAPLSLGAESHQGEMIKRVNASLDFALDRYKENVEAVLLKNITILQFSESSGNTIKPPSGLTEEKEKKWRQVCAPTVPLALFQQRIFTAGDILQADIKVVHHGAQDFKGMLDVNMECGGIYVSEAHELKLKSGRLNEGFLFFAPVDDGALVPPDDKPCKGSLTATVRDANGREVARNSWEIWLYPSYLDQEIDKALEGIHLATTLDEAAQSALDAGKRVLLLNDRQQAPCKIRMSKRIPGIATERTGVLAPFAQINGIFCNPAHPLFTDFPTNSHAEWQWWHLVKASDNYVLDAFPKGFTPIVQLLHDSWREQKVGMIFEAMGGHNGRGKLLVCAVDKQVLFKRPEGRQLLICMANYMKSDAFQPCKEMKLK